MEVFVKHGNLPESCDVCKVIFLQFPGIMCCPLSGANVTNQRYEKERHPCCPIKEIPIHGRLIDADELIRRIQESGNYLSPAILAYIETAPTLLERDG